MASKVYTRGGDSGQTALFRGGRVSKDNPRVETYGCVDELNSVLGMALAFEPPERVTTILRLLQGLLLELGAELATSLAFNQRPKGICDEDISHIESLIDELDAELEPLKFFILPGGSPVAALLHVARTTCRRAERRAVTLVELEPQTSPFVVKFLNRISDLFFVLARWCNRAASLEDRTWKPRE